MRWIGKVGQDCQREVVCEIRPISESCTGSDILFKNDAATRSRLDVVFDAPSQIFFTGTDNEGSTSLHSRSLSMRTWPWSVPPALALSTCRWRLCADWRDPVQRVPTGESHGVSCNASTII